MRVISLLIAILIILACPPVCSSQHLDMSKIYGFGNVILDNGIKLNHLNEDLYYLFTTPMADLEICVTEVIWHYINKIAVICQKEQQIIALFTCVERDYISYQQKQIISYLENSKSMIELIFRIIKTF